MDSGVEAFNEEAKAEAEKNQRINEVGQDRHLEEMNAEGVDTATTTNTVQQVDRSALSAKGRVILQESADHEANPNNVRIHGNAHHIRNGGEVPLLTEEQMQTIRRKQKRQCCQQLPGSTLYQCLK